MLSADFYTLDGSSQTVTLDVHLDPEQVYDSYGNGDILPAIIVMCSSGFAVYKVG